MSGKNLLDAFPATAIDLLSGSGRDFIRRIGEEAARAAVLGVLKGENVRTQTEYLTRARISQLSAAVLAQYVSASSAIPGFSENFFEVAKDAIAKKNRRHPAYLSAQWFLGLTGKSVQNVLRGDSENLTEYVEKFSAALTESARRVQESIGEYNISIDGGSDREVELNWERMLRVTTAIGAQTLTVRGSDKSMYGKLFERLVLGTVLSMLGFHLVSGAARNVNDVGAFWLSDSEDTRECDATAVIGRGRIIRFDIGFIGPGNSEISKDKLSRFSAEGSVRGAKAYSRTFIVVDRLPDTSKTLEAARRLGAEIVQMSMKFWPIELARKLKEVGWSSSMSSVRESNISTWLEREITTVSLLPLIGDIEIAASAEAAA